MHKRPYRTFFCVVCSHSSMVYTDPYTPTRSRYECRRCGYRESTDSLRSCPECNGQTQNIAVGRE
ncbi:rubrerythrin-like domain-containing protein [Natronolimnobius sp. AArcel1]|uniref:rubrerythrin-like domain-containing protein n=1 Tax=Natronolimnobius sp. AArcel1 TaxID=1679093 RepID=UPI003741F7F5